MSIYFHAKIPIYFQNNFTFLTTNKKIRTKPKKQEYSQSNASPTYANTIIKYVLTSIQHQNITKRFIQNRRKNNGFMSIKAGDPLKKFVPRMASHQTPYMDGLNYLMRQSQRREQRFQGIDWSLLSSRTSTCKRCLIFRESVHVVRCRHDPKN